MRTTAITLVAIGVAGVLAAAVPARADEVIEERERIETAPAQPVVKEKVIKEETHHVAPPVVTHKSKTVVKKGDAANDNEDDDDNIDD